MRIVDSMKLVGFNTPDRKNMRVYQKVRRLSTKLVVVEKGKKDPPVQVNLSSSNASSVSALSSDERNSSRREPTSATGSGSGRGGNATGRSSHTEGSGGTVAGNNSNDSESRTVTALVGTTSNTTPKSPKKKKSRRTSKELQRHYAVVAGQTNRDREAMKIATRRIYQNSLLPRNHPEKQTNEAIVKVINTAMNSGVSHKTAADYVRKGMIGISPLKRGPVGPFPSSIYKALQGAFVTFLKLEQAEAKRQSTIKQMSRLVNACVNKAGHNKTRDDLTRKLKRETADQFGVGKANIQEHWRAMWTTSYNLGIWFDTFKDTVIDLGFGRAKEDGDGDVEGEVVFFEGQKRRIINLDETDGSLDDTTGQRGGRPPLTFLASDEWWSNSRQQEWV